MATPAHPYTKALLALAPDPESASRLERRRLLVPGETPSPDPPPTGCRCHPRCMYAQDSCREVTPELVPTGVGALAVEPLTACHLAEDVKPGLRPCRRRLP